jgi:hypothetical protein
MTHHSRSVRYASPQSPPDELRKARLVHQKKKKALFLFKVLSGVLRSKSPQLNQAVAIFAGHVGHIAAIRAQQDISLLIRRKQEPIVKHAASLSTF